MRALTLLHRWLGVAFCLFFTIWFASGIVMHFVPFPRLTEAERLAGLSILAEAKGAEAAVSDVGATAAEKVARYRHRSYRRCASQGMLRAQEKG